MQKILVGSTQTLKVVPRVNRGGGFLRRQPTSVHFKIATPAEPADPAVAFTAGTVNSYSTTLGEALSVGDTEVDVAAAAGFVDGDSYLVNIEGDDDLEVELRAKTVNGSSQPTTVTLAQPALRAVATGAAVRGWVCSIALTAGQTASPGNATARARVVIGGVTHEFDVAFRIVRRIPWSGLTPTLLTQAYPIVETIRPESDVDFEETIRLAWEDEILPLLAAKEIPDENVHNAEALRPLHALACVLMLARPDPKFSRDTLATLEAQWTRRLDTTFARSDWYDAVPLEVPTPAPESGSPRRSSYRLVR